MFKPTISRVYFVIWVKRVNATSQQDPILILKYFYMGRRAKFINSVVIRSNSFFKLHFGTYSSTF